MRNGRFGILFTTAALCSLSGPALAAAPAAHIAVVPAVSDWPARTTAAERPLVKSRAVIKRSAIRPAAAPAVWKPLAIGAGGYIVGINLHPNGVDRIIRTDTYGAYVWRGKAWAQLVTTASMPAEDRQVTGIGAVDAVFAPSDANRIYLFFNDRMYRSDNKGVTFTRLPAFVTAASNANDGYRDTGYKVAVDPANADVIYVGTRDDGLRRSLDGGATWTTITDIPVGLHARDSNGNVTDAGAGVSILFDRKSGLAGGRTGTLYVGSWKNGIWQSRDGGTSWSQIADGNASPQHLARGDIAADGTLFVADESGRLWKRPGSGWLDLAAPVGVRAVAVDPRNAARVYAFSGAGEAARSLDGGASWTKLAYPNTLTAATASAMISVAAYPSTMTGRDAVNRPIRLWLCATSIMATMIGTATTPLITALQNSALIGSKPDQSIAVPSRVAAAITP